MKRVHSTLEFQQLLLAERLECRIVGTNDRPENNAWVRKRMTE